MKRSIVLVVLLTLCSAFGLAQTIRNSNQSAIAKIDAYGTIRNSNNSYLGKIESCGTVRNSNNFVLGKVERDGTVRDSFSSSTPKDKYQAVTSS